jgi:hypothetical protein
VHVNLFPEGSKLTPRDLFQVLLDYNGPYLLSGGCSFRKKKAQKTPSWNRIGYIITSNARLRKVMKPKFNAPVEKRLLNLLSM